MMKLVAVVLLVVAGVFAAELPLPQQSKILESEFTQNPDGAYKSSFKTENGIERVEQGDLKEALDEENKPHTVVVVKGSYKYPQPDGTLEEIKYYADESGFHAEGKSVPKAARR